MIVQLAEREKIHVNTYCARNFGYANFMEKLKAGRVAPRKMAAVARSLQQLL